MIAQQAHPIWQSMLRVLGTAGTVIAATAIAGSAAIALGAYWSALPYVGTGGPFAFSLFAPHMVLVPLLATAWMIALPVRRQLGAKLLIALGIAAVALSANALWQIMEVARAEGASISLTDALDPHDTMMSTPTNRRVEIDDGRGGKIALAIYAPADAGAAPVIVHVHGGAFIGGTHLQRGDDFRWFARQGFATVSIDYSLSNEGAHHWDTAIAEIGCALAWTAANASEFGGDGSRIVLLGDSAGGNLVLNAAYRAAAGTLPQSCAGRLPQIAAVGALYPVVSVADFHDNPIARSSEGAKRAARLYTGGSPGEFPERYRATDPVTHLLPQSPPTLIIHGEADTLVRISDARWLVERAEEIGAPVRLISLPFTEHAFDKRATIGNQLMRQTMAAFFAAQTER